MENSSAICPHCNAKAAPNTRCWLCHGDVGSQTPKTSMDSGAIAPSPTLRDAYQPPPPIDIHSGGQSTIVAFVLVGGLLVVCAVLFRTHPGLAFWIAILSTPALIRTSVVIIRKERRGEVVSTGERSLLFFASVGSVLVALFASAGAFLIACTATCFGMMAFAPSSGEAAGMIIFGGSFLISLVVGGIVLFGMWRKKR